MVLIQVRLGSRLVFVASLPGSTASNDAWAERNHDTIQRALSALADGRESHSYDTTTIPVALRELSNLIAEDDPLG